MENPKGGGGLQQPPLPPPTSWERGLTYYKSLTRVPV